MNSNQKTIQMIIQEAWKAMREIDDANIYGMKDLFQTVDFMQAIKRETTI